jgi:hypothetical protein
MPNRHVAADRERAPELARCRPFSRLYRDKGLSPGSRGVEMNCTLFAIRRALALALTLSAAAAPVTAATPSRGTAYLSSIGGTLFRASYYFDGATLTVSSATPSAATVRGGGALRLPDHRVVVVGAGNVSLYDPIAHTLELASSMTNANTATFDPNGTRLWVGWKDTPLSEVPLDPFGNGTPHNVTGDDAVRQPSPSPRKTASSIRPAETRRTATSARSISARSSPHARARSASRPASPTTHSPAT